MTQYTVRPSNADKAPFRINLTSVSLLSLKLRPGDLCTLHLPDDDDGHLSDRVAIAWENSATGMKDTIVQTSKLLQELYGLKLGDRVTIKRSLEKLEDADTVQLRSDDILSKSDQDGWSFVASATIRSKFDVLATSQNVVISVGDLRKEFEVVSLGDGRLGRITKDTRFTFDSATQSTSASLSKVDLDFRGIGGLQTQLSQIKLVTYTLFSGELTRAWADIPLCQGILLYGPHGTGKSLLQKRISLSKGWSTVMSWRPGQAVTSAAKGPRLILIDLDDFSLTKEVVVAIRALFEAVETSLTLVVGTTRHPNDITDRLRSSSAFSIELELPVPDSQQRLDILRALRGGSQQPDDEMLKDIATRTHGFVGEDLQCLLREAWYTAMGRKLFAASVNGVSAPDTKEAPTAPMTLFATDIEEALKKTGPSALKEIFLEKPNVRWSDIGGQDIIKKQLQNAVDMPLYHADRMKILGLVPKKGVLLYGPPGCSKTLMVKALATEADLNFLAVKGAELISMYVGESEKATREVFRKARQASPSIIFFDEIDAIASRGRTGSDLNVLTTLLTEMDGFEESKNVFVIAATNKPQNIDPALLRPGRFDNVVYVGPPDMETRRKIFDQRFSNISAQDDVKVAMDEFAATTDGCSGAEITAICQAAGEHAFEADRDFVTREDVIRAIASTPKNITRSMLREYEKWNADRTGA